VQSEVIPLLKSHVEDDQDYVRFMAVESCIALCSKIPREVAVEQILVLAKKLATDSAWRVRYMAATHFCDVCFILNFSHFLQKIKFLFSYPKDLVKK